MQNTRVMRFPKQETEKVKKAEMLVIDLHSTAKNIKFNLSLLLYRFIKAYYPIIFLALFILAFYNI